MKKTIALLSLLSLAGCATHQPEPDPEHARAIRGEYMLNRSMLWTAEDAAHFAETYLDANGPR